LRPESSEPGSKSRRFFPYGLGVLVALAVFAAVFFGERGEDPVGRGRTAPDFVLPALSGTASVSLRDLRGKVVLLNFWATWCKPCLDEMPAMERLYTTLKGEGEPFELLAISVDEDRAEVEQFRERLKLSFPILLDPKKRTARTYQTYKFPETLLLDAEGIVVARFIGPRDWDVPAYRERIRKLWAADEEGL